MKNNLLDPFPSGWFSVAFSHELEKGKILSRKFMNQEVVVFRNEKGEAHALDAHCPHLGAHLGCGGVVVGDRIRCPFHNFEFDGEGHCCKTGYNTKVPKNLKANTWPLKEQNGFIFLHHNPKGESIKDLPSIETKGWTRSKFFSEKIKSHPQEIVENLLDLGHFSELHHSSFPELEKNLR